MIDEVCIWIGRGVLIAIGILTVALTLISLCRKMGARDNLSDYLTREDIEKYNIEPIKCPMCEGTLDLLPSGAVYCKRCNPRALIREREFHEMMARYANEDGEDQALKSKETRNG